MHGSNPIRILRADGTSEVKAKGTVCTLYPGDRVDLSFNAKQNIGHYRLLVTHIEPDHEAIYTMAPVATSLLHKPPTSTQAFTQAQLASQPVPNSTPQLSELSYARSSLSHNIYSIININVSSTGSLKELFINGLHLLALNLLPIIPSLWLKASTQ